MTKKQQPCNTIPALLACFSQAADATLAADDLGVVGISATALAVLRTHAHHKRNEATTPPFSPLESGGRQNACGASVLPGCGSTTRMCSKPCACALLAPVEVKRVGR